MDTENNEQTQDNQPEAPELHELREIKLLKLRELQEAGNDPYREVRYDRTHCAAGIEACFDDLEDKEVLIAGRITARREHGKAGFADLLDESGKIQLFFRLNDVGEEAFERFKTLDLGDIIGVKGTVMKTRTGQVSVRVAEYTLLTKILETLPDKWSGLSDVDQRYRQRYVDMIVNREVFTTIKQRSQAVSAIRRHLDGKGFLEVETPMLHPIAGGATAEPFVTHWNALKSDFYLRIAIELHLKRLIVGGLEKVYEIGRVFRNEGLSPRHNPEFTMLELYWAYVDYEDIMQLTEELVVHLADEVFKTRQVTYGEYELDLTPPFKRLSFDAAMREYAGVGLDQLGTLDDVVREAERLDVYLPDDVGFVKGLDEIFKEKVEPNLIQPTFIYDYPKGMSPLAKTHNDNSELAYRFELFIANMELANSFSELNDPVDQRARMTDQIWHTLDNETKEVCQSLLETGNAPEVGIFNVEEAARMMLRTTPSDYSQVMIETVERDKRVAFIAATRGVILITRALHALDKEIAPFSSLLSKLDEYRIYAEDRPGEMLQHNILSAFDASDVYLSCKVDEDFINALEVGMPPTGGLGIGVDRLIMLLSGTPSIREVIPFPQLRKK